MVSLSFSVVVPDGPFDGRELTFDVSPSQITPPHVILIFCTRRFIDNVTQTWLGFLNLVNQRQAWVFDLILL
jgi:hypothetical protein